MSELNKIIRTTQEVFDQVVEGTHATHTYDDNNIYEVELAAPLLIGEQNSGLSINNTTNELTADVRDVKINSTSILNNGVANIPMANGQLGAVWVNNYYGIDILANGQIYIRNAAESEIAGKAQAFKVISPQNLDIAVREGLGNNSLTWTDQYKSNARTTIGAEAADATILKQADVIDNLATTSALYPLSANQGYVLQTEINNIKSIGRFLTVLDCSNGTVGSQPSETVGATYAYKVGDYYRVGAAGNYTPKGTLVYTVDATSGSSNFEQGEINYGIGDVIYCSSITATASVWVRQESTGGGKVQDVRINNVSILSSGIANIPIAVDTQGASTLGVVKTERAYGLAINSNGLMYINAAQNNQIEAKSGNMLPITPSYIDKTIKEGLGNYNLGSGGAGAWSDEYKSHAREVIGAGAPTIAYILEAGD